ncbi:MAG: zinc ribbon domain-containing protein [Planctomycetota bacterium]|nr:zinc ribbon domain-containing protein [Planctomycetota bacterium]
MDPDVISLGLGGLTPLVDPLTERTNLADARNKISSLRDAVADLERHVDKQATLLQAMYSLLSERLGLTEAELLARFQQIDAGRGESNAAIMCAECGRPVDLRHNRCLYCGAARQVKSAFELL